MPQRIYPDRTEQRFWAKVDQSGDCWLWTGARITKGYGRIYSSRERRQVYTHRLSFAIHNPGIDMTGLVVMHTCDNPPCVNPAHLRLGTTSDNQQDMARKGRGSKRWAVFSDADVRAICADPRMCRDIAADYGVRPGTISQLKRRETYKHVDVPSVAWHGRWSTR